MKKSKTSKEATFKTTSSSHKSKGLSGVSKLNKYALLVFIVAFGVAGYFVWHSFAATGTVGDCVVQPSWGTEETAFESELVQAVNTHRTQMGLNPLTPATALTRTAFWKSMDMSEFQYMDHDDLPGTVPGVPGGRTISQRFAACGYPTDAAWGENLAYGFTKVWTSDDSNSQNPGVMDAFLSDEGHRENIENPAWTNIGVGVAQASNGLIFWAQDFGTTSQDDLPPPDDNQPPTTPKNLTISATKTNELDFQWSASTDNDQVAGYDVYLNGQLQSTVLPNNTSADVANLQCGTSYTIGVDAVDRSGNKSGIATVTASTSACQGGDTQPPTTPKNLTVTTTQTSANLNWKASTDNEAVVGYDLYQNSTAAGTTSTTSGTINGLACGTTYTFGVDAYDASGNKSGMATKSATTAQCSSGGTVPGTPSSVTAAPGIASGVALSWNAAPSNASYTIKDYQVWRSGKPGQEVLQKTVKCTAATCATKLGGASGKKFYFEVRAEYTNQGATVEGPFSPEVSTVAK